MPSQYQPITPNPFYDAYTALWTMLEANTDFLGWFANTGQRVKLNENWVWAPNPDPQDLTPADFPRIRMAWSKINPRLERNSCGSEPEWVFALQVWTGSQQQTLLTQIMWPILRACTTWRQYVRDVVTWSGRLCVVDVDPQGFEVTNPDLTNKAEKARGYDQWLTIGEVSVQFSLKTADMQQV